MQVKAGESEDSAQRCTHSKTGRTCGSRVTGGFAQKLVPHIYKDVWGIKEVTMRVRRSGVSTKARLAKDAVRGKRPIRTIPRTSGVMPEDQNQTCS